MKRKIFSSALTRQADWRDGLAELVDTVKKGLRGQPCDAAVFFVSEGYPEFEAGEFARRLHGELGARVSLGCNASGVIGDAHEVEMEPAASILAMRLEGVRLLPFSFSPSELGLIKTGSDLVSSLDLYPTDKPNFICLADPASCDVERLLGLFNDGYGKCPVIGGLASGGAVGVPNWMALDGRWMGEGMAGLALAGDIEFDIAVAQGCRPVGKPFIVTKAEENVIYEMGGKTAFATLREVLDKLSPREKESARQAVFVGLVMNEKQHLFAKGDFLVRNIIGLDPSTGALVVGAHVKTGQTLQFHLRDAETSGQDLREHLAGLKPSGSAPRGALVVNCCGRGKGLYGEADHDIRLIQEAAGPLAAAGFFANGEIGPVAARNFVHGYTSSLAIIR